MSCCHGMVSISLSSASVIIIARRTKPLTTVKQRISTKAFILNLGGINQPNIIAKVKIFEKNRIAYCNKYYPQNSCMQANIQFETHIIQQRLTEGKCLVNTR